MYVFTILAVNLFIGVSLQTPTKYQNVNQMIEYINSVQNEWIADKTFDDNYKLSDLKVKLSTLPVKKGVLQIKPKSEYPNIDIPKSFDSRHQWPECQSIKEIRDQGNCGSCWAFAVVEAISDRICIASKSKQQVEISAENLVACCTSCGDGCHGGFEDAAWQYYVKHGLVTGGLYNSHKGCQPYSLAACEHHTTGHYPPCGKTMDPTPKCHQKCATGYNVSYTHDLHFGSKAYDVDSDVEAIQTEIMTNGPVSAGFSVYEDFLTYKSGVYHHVTGSGVGGHAVKVIGWGVENGVDYWLVANSWNEDWGDKGLFKIKRGTNECNFESGISAGLPKLN
ncbi:cathepsin B-like cysteine proteinase [Oppia nitens]|uniref:cathepsin B-like cysteine proteinase n=1 Tax=Oppia nitens TaxID=1686743 RepID=UPI0023DA26F5|nr:cathepsin B-like cysteine proteinase [Oppia nitens]